MKRTTATKLQQAIAADLVTVISVTVKNEDHEREPISADKFKEDLEFYVNSGIFADTIDFTFERVGEDKLHVAIGKMSCYCYDDIDVILQINDPADDVTEQLHEDLYKKLPA